MTPAALIADLDSSLAATGQAITVRRYTATTGDPRPKTDIDNVNAHVRPLKPDELVGPVQQADTKVIVSPTGLSSLVPLKKGDKVVIQGKECNVEFPRHFYVQDTLVRLELMVRG